MKNIEREKDAFRGTRIAHLLLSRQGFSDKQIRKYCGVTEVEVRESRKQFGIQPFVKKTDTIFGEWSTQTNYFYITYHGNDDDPG